MLVQTVQVSHEYEYVREYVVVYFEYVLGRAAVLAYPFHGHYALVREIFVRVDEILLHNVHVNVRLETQLIADFLVLHLAHHKHQSYVAEHAATCPRFAQAQATLKILRRRMNVNEQEHIRPVVRLTHLLARIEHKLKVMPIYNRRFDEIILALTYRRFYRIITNHTPHQRKK